MSPSVHVSALWNSAQELKTLLHVWVCAYECGTDCSVEPRTGCLASSLMPVIGYPCPPTPTPRPSSLSTLQLQWSRSFPEMHWEHCTHSPFRLAHLLETPHGWLPCALQIQLKAACLWWIKVAFLPYAPWTQICLSLAIRVVLASLQTAPSFSFLFSNICKESIVLSHRILWALVLRLSTMWSLWGLNEFICIKTLRPGRDWRLW